MKDITHIKDDIQDRNCEAWQKLQEYIDLVATENRDEFSPLEFLGKELFSQIYVLPEEIGKLKSVRKIWLYGSFIRRIPREIGQMSSLEYLDVYTSYSLHWLPYEIRECKNLKQSRISTRALYGNFKNRLPFPNLKENPVIYRDNRSYCSVCKKETDELKQMWLTFGIGTDIVPLLVNVCSADCISLLPTPPKNYIQDPHQGGPELVQPLSEEELWELECAKDDEMDTESIEEVSEIPEYINPESPVNETPAMPDREPIQLLKLIRKLWDK